MKHGVRMGAGVALLMACHGLLISCNAPATGTVEQQTGASTSVDAAEGDVAGVDVGVSDDAGGASDAGGLPGTPTPVTGCPSWGKPVEQGVVANPAIAEASGIAASRKHPGVFWVHNDSGDKPRIFALDGKGATLATYRLSGADANDWEDIAVGPGPKSGETYVYVGDIGDNGTSRKSVQVYRVAEPAAIQGDGKLTGVDKLKLQYPDEPHNAETLMVDPRQGDLYLDFVADDVKRSLERLLTSRPGSRLNEIAEEIKSTAFRVTRVGELLGREVAARLALAQRGAPLARALQYALASRGMDEAKLDSID